MTLTDLMLVVSNSCTLLIKPNSKTELKDIIMCHPNDIAVEILDYVIANIEVVDKDLLLVTIWK